MAKAYQLNMRKILQLNVTANWGSTGKIAEEIGFAAMTNGWESYIGYGRMMNNSQSRLIKVGKSFDVYSHYVQNKFFDAEGLCSKKPTRELIAKISDINPDIIHLHNIHDHWLNYPILFDYLATIDTPIVWTFHDCWAFTGGCPYFEIPPCDKWRTQCEKCPLRQGKIDRSKHHYKLRRELIASLGSRLTTVPVSKWLEDFCKESMLSESNIQLIHNGIDVAKFKVCDDRTQKENMILGVANVWDYRKGLDDFIKLREVLSQEIKIKLVGLTKTQITRLPNGIEGITKTQNIDELVDLYNRANVFVNPTYADNFPTTNLEALACGTPVITYRTGGSPEAIDENTGIVVEKGNIHGLANSILEVINNTEKYKRDLCRERAVTHFNQDVQFGKYLELYNKLLSK